MYCKIQISMCTDDGREGRRGRDETCKILNTFANYEKLNTG